MVTVSTKAGEDERRWFVVDAADVPLGRLASRVATVLKGKHRPEYTPHVDTGDFVIVVNAEKVKLTGRKLDQKQYHHYSGYPGGMKARSYKTWMVDHPEEVVRKAVRGMLPKNRLGRAMLTKIKIYRGAEHPHVAQKPKPHTVESSRTPRGRE